MDPCDNSDDLANSKTADSLEKHIVNAIEEANGQPLDDKKPLYTAIDPDALKLLFAPLKDGSPRTVGYVSFQYDDYWVTVSSNGTVNVESEKR